MKKITLIIFIVMLLSACSNLEDLKESRKEKIANYETELIKIGEVGIPSGVGIANIDIVEDINSKCQYLYLPSSNKFAISPYYDESGKVKGCSKLEELEVKSEESNEEKIANYETELIKIGEVGIPGGTGIANIDIVEDINSKCKYLYLPSSNKFAISPYYDESGKIKGCKGS